MNNQTIKDDSDGANNMYDDKEYGLEEATDLGWEHFKVGRSQFRETLDRPSEFFIRDLDLPQMRAAMGPEWPGLKPSQRDDVVLMNAAETGKRGMANGGVLANGAGLGKTPDIIANELNNPLPGPSLIVMPVSLIDNWEEKFTKFTKPRLPTLRYHNKLSFDELQNARIVLVSYDQLRNEFKAIEQWVKDAQYTKRHPYPWPAYRMVGKKKPKRVYLKFQRPRCPLLRVRWKRVTYDEAQKCKNFRSTTGRACHALIAEIRWLVTGTRFINEYRDVYSIFRILRVAPFDDFNFFRSHFLRRLPKSTK
jgi:SNF2-related domain